MNKTVNLSFISSNIMTMLGPCKLFVHVLLKKIIKAIYGLFQPFVPCSEGKPSLNPCSKVNKVMLNHHYASSARK